MTGCVRLWQQHALSEQMDEHVLVTYGRLATRSARCTWNWCWLETRDSTVGTRGQAHLLCTSMVMSAMRICRSMSVKGSETISDSSAS